ncbi:hypothetical protein Y032_0147g2590 [Ancylostoma ceylanicum]|uniref:Uncharacterized protein n=1 Tax=Ancylostoma ceylanicum TaxID=53326 RepID=A0A016T2E8_9BILA|nr:hypothetical protein Y032_0147g2590 [Ancylostoma ceylanicum]
MSRGQKSGKASGEKFGEEIASWLKMDPGSIQKQFMFVLHSFHLPNSRLLTRDERKYCVELEFGSREKLETQKTLEGRKPAASSSETQGLNARMTLESGNFRPPK